MSKDKEEDPGREIFGYTQHIPVPVWADPKSSNNCAICSTKFSLFGDAHKAHNCRLCGMLVCTKCTGKYHIPIAYEMKGKQGPQRVCTRCRDSCLARKEAEKKAAAGPQKHAVMSASDLQAPTPIPAPTAGATAPPPRPAGAASGKPPSLPRALTADATTNVSLGNQASATMTCIAPGCTAVRVSKNGYCAQHVNEYGAGGTDLATSASLAIRWEGDAHILTRVAIPADKSQMNLVAIDAAFRRQCAGEFANRHDYEYVYKSEGIHEAFYDLFNASHFVPFGNAIFIRKKIDTNQLVAAYEKQGGKKHVGAIGSQAGAAAILPNGQANPFARNAAQEASAAAKAAKAEEAAAATKKSRVFHKPAASPATQAVARTHPVQAQMTKTKAKPPPPTPANGTGAGGPPPLSGASKPPPGPGPDQLKQRAKVYFGAH